MIVAVSQRVDVIEAYAERRDALDQRWAPFLARCGIDALPMPNDVDVVRRIFGALNIGGVLLTGGNDLSSYGGNSPERDATERLMLEYAIARSIPVVGVCRGMQFILDFFGVALCQVDGHRAVRHAVRSQSTGREVNSFHNWGTFAAGDSFVVTSTAPDGVIESIRHTTHPISGMMWHPERELTFCVEDLNEFSTAFGTTKSLSL